MTRMPPLLALLLCWSVSATPVRVIDGDTFVADAVVWIDQTNRVTVRVANVNTPERGQPGATEATAYAMVWLRGSRVTLRSCGADSFGRVLATVTREGDGANLGVDLIQTGHAVPYTK